MSDISKIKPQGATGAEYNIKDTTARSSISDINAVIPNGASSSNQLLTASDRPDLGFYIDNDGDLCQN